MSLKFEPFSKPLHISVSAWEDGTGGNVKRFRGGLVFKAHRRVYHSTLGVRVIQKEEEGGAEP